MRQTSKAVLLLISAASAGQLDPAFNPIATQQAATTAVTQGKWVGYLGKPIYRQMASGATLNKDATVGVTSSNVKGGVTDAGISCIACMRGKKNGGANRTVWCSAGWNYEYTALKLDKSYPKLSKGEQAWIVSSVDNGDTDLVKGDLGFCCYTSDTFDTLSDIVNDATDAGALKVDLFNKWTCPAKFTNSWEAASTGANNSKIVLSTENWWCSDGSYNVKSANAAYGTKVAAANSNNATWNTGAANSKKLQDKSKLYGNVYTKDRRDELLFAQCRQKRLLCGGKASIVDEAKAVSPATADNKRAIDFSTNGFSETEKCTWVLRSKTKAPSFAITNVAAKPLTDKVDVVYQEWVDGWQLTDGTDFFSGYDGTTAYTQGGVPNFAMAKAKYDTAYKFNYNTEAELAGSPYSDSMKLNTQRGGDAWVYQAYGKGCVPAAAKANDKDDAGGANASCFEKSAKRWISSLDVSGPTHLNAVKDTYDSALGTFNTAAASYNTYLADLKTANEKDAFSAFFSPPKKPAMVKRPGAPTKPAAYTGLAHWPAADQAKMLGAKTNAPTNNGKQFVLGNNLNGGWGAWTSSRLTNIGTTDWATNKISHSFGMLGTSQSATAAWGMGYLKNWQKANTAGAQTTTQIQTSHTGNVMCASSTQTTADHLCIPAGSTKTTANAKYAYLNVSVWANDAITSTQYTAEVTVEFYASTWANGKAYYAPAAAADGTALTEPAGAHALAASAAAVVAVAAALY